jgi:DUF1365 family protein
MMKAILFIVKLRVLCEIFNYINIFYILNDQKIICVLLR